MGKLCINTCKTPNSVTREKPSKKSNQGKKIFETSGKITLTPGTIDTGETIVDDMKNVLQQLVNNVLLNTENTENTENTNTLTFENSYKIDDDKTIVTYDVLNGKSMLQKQQLFKGSHKKCIQNSVLKSSNSKTNKIPPNDFFFEDKEKDKENIPLQKTNT